LRDFQIARSEVGGAGGGKRWGGSPQPVRIEAAQAMSLLDDARGWKGRRESKEKAKKGRGRRASP